jgi:hypothetical protein
MDLSVFQEIISKIDGIMNVRIIGDNGEMKEMHILANKLRAPKQIVRDIESSLIASFDYRIDRKVISIAQIDTDDSKAISRIRYEGISVSTNGNVIEATVKLSCDEEETEISISGIRTIANSRKIIAEAAVRAVEKIIGQPSIFDIQDVIVADNRNLTFVSVIVNMLAGFHEESMVGSVIVKNDINEAIVKATLDAVNRKVQRNN